MTLSPAAAAAFAAAVRSERLGVQKLVEALAQERQILRAGDTDRLSDSAASKRELLVHVANSGEHRHRLLRKAGVSADRRGMNALLAQTPSGDELHTEWQLLVDATSEAHRLNQENGTFIEASMRANQQALSVLLSAASGGTYGPAGRAVNPLPPRTLASA